MRRIVLGLIVLISTSSLASAWDRLGHRATAEIATTYLSESAAAEIRELLGEGLNVLVAVSNWADEIIDDRPETYFWHSVEIPHDGENYQQDRDCSANECVVEKLKEFVAILADRHLPKPQRADALKFVVHFVADIHVPFHTYAPGTPDDIWGLWGGWEGPWMQIGDKTDQLHDWWDNRLVAALGPDASGIARTLEAEITPDHLRAWTHTAPEDWANESFRIARQFVIKHGLINPDRIRENSEDNPIVLAPSTIDEVKPIVAQRLKMAGVRLAWLLNQSLK